MGSATTYVLWVTVLASPLAAAKPPSAAKRDTVDLDQQCANVSYDFGQGAHAALLTVRAFRFVCGGRPLPASFVEGVRAHLGDLDDGEQAAWAQTAREQDLDAATWEAKSAEWLRASQELRIPPKSYVDATSVFCAAATVVNSPSARLCDEARRISETLDATRNSRRGAFKLSGLFKSMVARLHMVERNRARLLQTRYRRRTDRQAIESYVFAQLVAQVADKILPELLAVVPP